MPLDPILLVAPAALLALILGVATAELRRRWNVRRRRFEQPTRPRAPARPLRPAEPRTPLRWMLARSPEGFRHRWSGRFPSRRDLADSLRSWSGIDDRRDD